MEISAESGGGCALAVEPLGTYSKAVRKVHSARLIGIEVGSIGISTVRFMYRALQQLFGFCRLETESYWCLPIQELTMCYWTLE